MTKNGSIAETPIEPVSMEDVPLGRFHYKVFACSAGCPILDGYALGIIAVALAQMHTYVEMSALMAALIGMGTLGGMFLGSLFGGQITDMIGRRKMFVLDFLFVVIVCVLGFFFTDPMAVFIFRILLGIGLGADYPIAGPYVSEFMPRKSRGSMVGAINAFWYVGYAVSFIIGYLMIIWGGPDVWRWMLASPGIVALIWLIARWFMPESPRWLMSQGRDEEAQEVLKKIGPNVILPEHDAGEVEKMGRIGDIFKGGYGKWVFFVAAFWSCIIMPNFGIGTYTPIIMEILGFAEGNLQYLGAAIVNVFYLLGIIPIFFLIESLGRRPTLIWCFIVSGAALVVLGATSGRVMPFWFILVFFVVYGAFTVAMGAHNWVYPNELFPTHIRGTAMGFITAITRITSAAATFVFPFVMDAWGLGVTLFICAGILFAGAVISIIMAPETRGIDLSQAANLT